MGHVDAVRGIFRKEEGGREQGWAVRATRELTLGGRSSTFQMGVAGYAGKAG